MVNFHENGGEGENAIGKYKVREMGRIPAGSEGQAKFFIKKLWREDKTAAPHNFYKKFMIL